MTHEISFTKMHGIGNDYIYVDAQRFPIAEPEHLSILWSNRNKGIGGDGLVLIDASEVADFKMRIFNNDGSEARMCGNASRCIGKYVYDNGLTTKTAVTLETLSGIKILHLHLGKDGKVDSVTVDMDEPQLQVASQCTLSTGVDQEVTTKEGRTYRGTFVSMGNPHFVIFVDDLEQIDLTAEGKALEHHEVFPERCNIEFVQVTADGHLRTRVWERGSGITLACGTGACATAVAAALTGRSGRTATVDMDGGTLSIEWREGDNHVYMTGGATTVFEGKIPITPLSSPP